MSTPPPTVVVGTAGHVDHGKSSLVRALTGTDPDRLKEEQERGITIDLGFAHLDLPGGPTLSFVDVPGHERFVRNMLAGAAGVDVVLLVVAADESVMPQTREHLDICRMLDVRAGVVAVTKADLVDEETLELVRLEVAELVAGTFLEGAPMVACSATRRSGLDELVAALVAAVAGAAPRSTAGPLRLPIDRVFTLRGFGTVVTGTAVAGGVSAGDEVEILPAGRGARVRGVQVHGRAAERGLAGQRVALNLGGLEHRLLERGDVVVAPGSHVATSVLDADVTLLPEAPPPKDLARVRLHLGTAEVLARVRWCGGEPPAPGQRRCAQLRLEAPVVAAVGDRCVLRRYSPIVTIGGGRVVNPRPARRLRRGDAGAAAALEEAAAALRAGDAGAVLAHVVEQQAEAGAGAAELGALLGTTAARVREVMAHALDTGRVVSLGGAPERYLAGTVLARAEARLLERLAALHAADPLSEGASKQAALGAAGLPEALLPGLLARLEASGRLRVDRDTVSLPGHSVRLSPAESAAREALLRFHREARLQPPDLPAVLQALSVPRETALRLVKLMLASGALVRLREGMLADGEAMAGLLRDMASWYSPGEAFSVPDFKERSGVSRKHAIPLLEWLDAQGFTRRSGEGRTWTGKEPAPAAETRP